MKLLRIKKWNETFENADSRKRKRLGYFLCPSGVDSAGYIELMTYGADGVTAYAVMLSICQWSATCVPEVRGTCARSNGTPLSVAQLAMHLRMPTEIVQASIDLLTQPDVGWMEWVEVGGSRDAETVNEDDAESHAGDVPTICQSSADDLPVACHKSKSKSKSKSKEKSKSSTHENDSLESDWPPGDEHPMQTHCREEREFISEWNAAAENSGLTAYRGEKLTHLHSKAFWEAMKQDGWRQRARDALKKFPLAAGTTFALQTFLIPHTADRILNGEFDRKFGNPGDHKPKKEFAF